MAGLQSIAIFEPKKSGAYDAFGTCRSGDDSATFEIDPQPPRSATRDSASSVRLTPTPACFLRGTRMATPGGEVSVEALAIDDLVLTASGAAKPVKWIGRRSFAWRFVIDQPRTIPVCVHAGALGAALPRADLYLSPEHGLFIDGMLIPAGMLVNGRTVTQNWDDGVIDYFHIEVAARHPAGGRGAGGELRGELQPLGLPERG